MLNKKHVFLICVLVHSLLSNGQIQDSRFSVGTYFSPDLTYRLLRQKNENLPFQEENDSIYTWRQNYDTDGFGFSGGFYLSYEILPKLILEAGVQYAYHVQNTAWVEYTNTYSGNLEKKRWRYTNGYFLFPIKLMYNLRPAKFCLYGGAGISPGLLSEGRTITYTAYMYGNSVSFQNHSAPFETTNLLFGSIFTGLNIPISSVSSLKLEPYFRLALNPTNRSEIAEFPWSAGANFCVQLNL